MFWSLTRRFFDAFHFLLFLKNFFDFALFLRICNTLGNLIFIALYLLDKLVVFQVQKSSEGTRIDKLFVFIQFKEQNCDPITFKSNDPASAKYFMCNKFTAKVHGFTPKLFITLPVRGKNKRAELNKSLPPQDTIANNFIIS